MEEKIRILAIDDEMHMLRILGACLKPPDYELVPCNNPTEALTMFSQGRFDVILMDVVMPEIDGFTLNSMIRIKDAKIPIIMLTAKVDDISGMMLKRLSDDRNTSYLSKNFTKQDLVSKINDIVEDSRSRLRNSEYFAEIDKDLSIAGEIQEYLFPTWFSDQHKCLYSYYYKPYQKISGDIFNINYVRDGVALIIVGDISGHGISAALYISSLRLAIERLLRTTNLDEITPHSTLNYLQRFMLDISSDRYMTCLVVLADFNNNKIMYHSAGHPEFFVYSPSKDDFLVSDATAKGSLPVGMLHDTEYLSEDTVEMDIPEDAALFFYTDGVTDATGSRGEAMTNDIVQDMIRTFTSTGVRPETCYKVIDGIFKIGYSNVNDDVSMACVSKNILPENTEVYVSRPMLSDADLVVQGLYKSCVERTGDETFASRIEIAVSEIINNIIVHGMGNCNKANPVICVVAEFLEDSLKIAFYDKGKEFGPESLKAKVPVPEEGPRDSGRGISMVKTLVSSVMRSRYADMLNETILTINYKK